MSTYSVDLRDLLEAGCHFGHQSRRWNPKMKEYIFTDRDGVHIFDLAKTAERLIVAMEFVRDWVAEGKTMVFVGSKRQAAAIVREEALLAGAPYVDVRWLGGTLTNWEQMYRRIEKLREMKAKREAGDYKGYTKKERVLIDREVGRLERFFGGLAELRKVPEALFVVDTQRELTAVKEANMLGIPIVGMVDTNADPDLIDHLIPVNDDAVRSIKLVVNKIAKAYADGKVMREKGIKPVDKSAKSEEKKEEQDKVEKKEPTKPAVGARVEARVAVGQAKKGTDKGAMKAVKAEVKKTAKPTEPKKAEAVKPVEKKQILAEKATKAVKSKDSGKKAGAKKKAVKKETVKESAAGAKTKAAGTKKATAKKASGKKTAKRPSTKKGK